MGQTFQDLSILGQVVGYQSCAVDHDSCNGAVNVVQVGLQEWGNVIFDVWHVLFVDDILTEEQVVLGLKLIVCFSGYEPREAQFEDDLVLVRTHNVVEWR